MYAIATVATWADPHHGDVLQRVAKMAELSLAEWQAVAQRMPKGWEAMQLLLQAIQRSARTDTVLFCLDDMVILHHDGRISARGSSMRTHHTSERIRGKNEVLDPSARLCADELRSIFVMLEALVYKIVHITMENQSRAYSQRSEHYDSRLERLVHDGVINDDLRALALEIHETRNQFAHSLLSIEEIAYKGEPLRDRWGAIGVSGQRKFKRYFLSDVFKLSEALLLRFRQIQAQQLDGLIFRKALHDMIC